VQIYVQNTHLEPLLSQPQGQVRRNAAFANSTFAAHHQHFIPDAREPAAYEFFFASFLRAARTARAGFLIAFHPEVAPVYIQEIIETKGRHLKSNLPRSQLRAAVNRKSAGNIPFSEPLLIVIPCIPGKTVE
jgi:hypothetical protein